MSDIAFFNTFFADVMNKEHDLASDTLKVVLSNTAPALANTKLTDITQIANGNGYTAGGQALDNVTSTQTAGVFSLGADNEVFTASGGAIATFRYVVLYNDTHANDQLIGYWDHGTTIDLSDTQTCTITFPSGIVFTFQLDT